MGNKLGRRRQMVDEKYTRPQGLYNHKEVDHKKLRKLILESKLAPCYPGDEESASDVEECPICFLVCHRSWWLCLVHFFLVFFVGLIHFLPFRFSIIQVSIDRDVAWKAFVQVRIAGEIRQMIYVTNSFSLISLLFPECFLQMKVPNSTRPTQYPFSRLSYLLIAFLVYFKVLLHQWHACIS